MNTHQMIALLIFSNNELIASKAKSVFYGHTTIEEELKYCGSFWACVLNGDYEMALRRADGDNYFALTGKKN